MYVWVLNGENHHIELARHKKKPPAHEVITNGKCQIFGVVESVESSPGVKKPNGIINEQSSAQESDCGWMPITGLPLHCSRMIRCSCAGHH